MRGRSGGEVSRCFKLYTCDGICVEMDFLKDYVKGRFEKAKGDLKDNVKGRFEEAFRKAKEELDDSDELTALKPWIKRKHWIWVIFPQDDGGGQSAPGLGFAISSKGKYEANREYLRDHYNTYVEQLKSLGAFYFDTWRGLMLKILNGEMVSHNSNDNLRVNYVTERVGREFLKRLASTERVSGQSLKTAPGSLSTLNDANPGTEYPLQKALRVSLEEAEQAQKKRKLFEAATKAAIRASREEAEQARKKRKLSEAETEEECDCGFSASFYDHVCIRW